MKLKKLGYKGKHFVLADEDTPEDSMNYSIGTISKEEALEPEFVKWHKECCEYYGIPAYCGHDEDLLEAYK